MIDLSLSLLLLLFTPESLWASASPPTKKLSPGEVIKSSKASDWRSLRSSDTLYLNLKSGLVIMELNPDFAPQAVANIKKLTQKGYWDGLAILRSQDNYVASWGDPESMKPNGKVKPLPQGVSPTLPPEFEKTIGDQSSFFQLPDPDTYAESVGFVDEMPVGRDLKAKKEWLLHCYGAIGVARGLEPNSGNGAGLYVVTGHSPRHLDRNITVVGQVVYGMEHLSSLSRGTGNMGFYEKKSQYIPIQSLKMLKDTPAQQRVSLEILKTSSAKFAQYLESRRNRTESWFVRKAGRIEVCNAMPKIRLKK